MKKPEIESRLNHPLFHKKIELSLEQRNAIGAVIAIVINNEGQILGFKRNYQYVSPNGEQYRQLGPDDLDIGFPGGKVNPGESLEEGVLRELVEETGFIGKNPFAVFVDPGHPGGNRFCAAFVIQAFNCVDVNTIERDSVSEGDPIWVKPQEFLDPRFYYYDYNKNLLEYLELI